MKMELAALMEAHTIKGIAVNICAAPLLLAAQALERELKCEAPAPVDPLFKVLETRISELRIALACGSNG